MGRGNFLFRTKDGELNVDTYFVELGSDFESTKEDMVDCKRSEIVDKLTGLDFAMRRRKLAQIMMDGRYPIHVSDESVYNEMGDNQLDDIDNLRYEIDAIDGFRKCGKEEFDENICAGSHESALLLATSTFTIVALGENESDVAVACIPNFTHDEVESEFDEDDYEEDAEADWSKSAAELCKEAVDKEYEARIVKYKEEANKVMRTVHQYCGGKMSERNGPWTSCALPSPEEMDEKGIKYY